MCEAICEEVEGSQQFTTIQRKRDHDASPVYPPWSLYSPPWSFHSPGCYKFRCTCEIGIKTGWVGNKDWDFNKFDREKHCPHLFVVLTLYENQRNIERGGMLMDNKIHANEVRAFNAISKNFSYYLLEYEFNKSRYGAGLMKRIKLYDKSNINKYTVKCSAARDPVWECTCKGYKFRGCCKHINYVKNNEMYKQYRRELGISLALKYVTEK